MSVFIRNGTKIFILKDTLNINSAIIALSQYGSVIKYAIFFIMG
jgi:hypothetical protein